MRGVRLLLGEGRAEVAGQSHAIAPGPDGAVQLADGPTLRPLRFGERARLTRSALGAAVPEEDLSKAVLASSGGGDHPAAAAIALHLAGAGGSDLGFATAQSLLARQLGWTQSDIAEAPASDVDALADQWHRALQTERSGWTKMVFASAQDEPGEDPDAVALSLARDLLSRAEAALDPDQMAAAALIPMPGTGEQQMRVAGTALPTATGENAVVIRSATSEPAPVSRQAETQQDPAHTPPQAEDGRRGHGTATSVPMPSSAAQDDAAASGQLDPRRTGTGRDAVLAPHASDADASIDTPGGLPPQRGEANQPESNNPPPATTTPPPIATGIWRPRAPLAERPPLAGRTEPADDPAHPAAFAGWFDAPATQPLPYRDSSLAHNGWIWDRTEKRTTPTPNLPETASIADPVDATDALADALHLAADLRGIAP